MNRKLKSILWGLLLIVVGVLVTLHALEIELGFDPLFDGWWSLFIIVPCAIDLVTDKNKLWPLIGILVGVGLLLAARDVIAYSTLWKLVLPFGLILLGCYMLYRVLVQKPAKHPAVGGHVPSDNTTEGKTDTEYTAIFAGDDLNFTGKQFEGTKLTAIFGGIECDLRGALITHDVVIETAAIFGGIDIILPPLVKLRIENSVAILGGVENNFRDSADSAAPTVILRPTAIFGGVEAK